MHKEPKLDTKMKTFQQYVREMGEDLSSKGDNSSLMQACHIACQDHEDELTTFLHSLAAKDNRIRQALDAHSRDANNSKAKHKGGHLPPYADDDDKDIVVPSGADNAGGYEPGGG
jgi:hypothetical protein